MPIATGQLAEIFLGTLGVGGRINCAKELIPGPGQYLLAQDGSDAPLPGPVFLAGHAPGGFLAAPPLPGAWNPGARLQLRGPLGRGFSIPPRARRAALVAFDETPARLLPLIPLALAQGAAVTLVCDTAAQDLPEEVEAQPIGALTDVLAWADYLAIDAARDGLSDLREKLAAADHFTFKGEAQILVRTSMPCAGVADCGVCAVNAKGGSPKGTLWKMICKDGPVFDLQELFFK